MSARSQDRYPKRKRAEIKYAEPDANEDSDLDSGADSDIDTAAIYAEMDAAWDDIMEQEADPNFGSRKKAKTATPKGKRPSKKKVAPPRKPKPFEFMKLPGELRNQIYKLALTDPRGVHLRNQKGLHHNKVHHLAPQWCKPSGSNGTSMRFFNQPWLKDVVESPTARIKLSPNILVTCKAVHTEAAAILWTQPFYFADLITAHDFLYRISLETMAMLRSVTFVGWPFSQKNLSPPVFHLLSAATNLENLTIYDVMIEPSYRYNRMTSGPDGDIQRAKQLAQKLYRDLFVWIEPVYQAGGIEKIQKVLKLGDDNYREVFRSGSVHSLDECKKLMWEKLASIYEEDHPKLIAAN